MGLLDVVRRHPSATGAAADPIGAATASPGPAAPEEPPLDLQAITPSWKQLPPLQPVVPPMPLSFLFDKNAVPLARGTARFLEDLGHLVSADAPSGLVEGIAVLTPEAPEPTAEPVVEHQWDETPASSGLPLSPPRARQGQSQTATARTVMRLPDSTPIVGDIRSVAPETGSQALTLAETDRPGEVAPVRAVVLVRPEAVTAARTAPMPADLPLLPMPSLPIPEELKIVTPAALEQTADLVGVGPLASAERPDMATLDDGEQLLARSETDQDGDLPLATPPTAGPESTLPATVMRLDDPRRSLVSPTDPPASDPGPPSPPETASGVPTPAAPSTPVAQAGPSTALPAAVSEASVTAPLVGHAPTTPKPADPAVLDPGRTGVEERPLEGEAPLPLAPRVQPEGGAPIGTPLSVFGPDSFSTPESASDVVAFAGAGLVGGSVPAEASPEAQSAGGSEAADAPTADGPAVAPLVGAEDRMAVGPAPGTTAPGDAPMAGSATDLDVGPGPGARHRSGLGEPMAGLPSTARSYDLTRMTMTERRAMSLSLMQAELDRQTARNGGFGLALPSAGLRRIPARPKAAFVDASNPVPSVPGPPSIAGILPEGLPQPTDSLAELVAFREMGERVENREMPQEDEGERGRIAVGRLYGLDLDVKIDRTARTALEAHHAGARAFTTASGIFIPPEVGPLNSGPGEALLVHELTHVAQRQRNGGEVPDESSEEGRQLEAEALRNEHFFAATRTLPVTTFPVEAPKPPSLPVARPLFPTIPAFGTEPGAVPGGAQDGLPLASSGGFDVSAIADSVAAMVTERISAPAPPLSSEPAMSMQRAEVDTAPAQGSVVPESVETPGTAGMDRPPDADLDRLSGWLYPLIRFRLRKELREDRERAGRLTDLYRRW